MKMLQEHSFVTNENGERGKGGRMVCSVCGNDEGLRCTTSHRNIDSNKWTDRKTCLRCGSTERSLLYTGEIIEQKLSNKV